MLSIRFEVILSKLLLMLVRQGRREVFGIIGSPSCVPYPLLGEVVLSQSAALLVCRNVSDAHLHLPDLLVTIYDNNQP